MRQALSILLALFMLLTVAPLTVFAADGATTYKVGETFYFGTYPQSQIYNYLPLYEELNSLVNSETEWTSYDYYINNEQSDYMKYTDIEYEGERYRGVLFSSFRPSLINKKSDRSTTFQDDNGYYVNNKYWFKYEPVKWKVLSVNSATGNVVVMSDMVLDSQQYYNSTAERNINGKTVYPNNYEHSDIRAWLTGTFYDAAFSDTEKSKIVATTISNTAKASSAVYNSNSTTDMVWLLSYDEIVSGKNGFSYDSTRKAKGTNYAYSQGLYKKNSYCMWRLRNAAVAGAGTCFVSETGMSDSSQNINDTKWGVRPAMTLHLVHIAGEPVKENVKAATCDTQGSYDEVVYCTGCGDVISKETKTSNALGHDWGEWTVTVPATCTTAGEETHICKNDENHKETRDVKLLDHDYSVFVKVVENATCTEEGKVEYKCANCVAATIKETSVDESNHVATEIVNAKAASCTEDGYTGDLQCTACKTIIESGSVIDAAGHTPGAEVEENRVEATCTDSGSYDVVVYCTVCEAEISRETKTIDAAGHTPGAKVEENKVEATCTDSGSYDEVVYCTVCEAEISREPKTIDAAGHIPGEWAVTKTATCTEKGERVKKCTVCDSTLETEVIDAHGHSDANDDGKCDECGEGESDFMSRLTQLFRKIIRFFQKLLNCSLGCGE